MADCSYFHRESTNRSGKRGGPGFIIGYVMTRQSYRIDGIRPIKWINTKNDKKNVKGSVT